MREPGVEPGRVAPQDPKSCASASSATLALALPRKLQWFILTDLEGTRNLQNQDSDRLAIAGTVAMDAWAGIPVDVRRIRRLRLERVPGQRLSLPQAWPIGRLAE